MTTMRDLRHRVTLQSRVLTPLAGGQFAESWQDAATLWAAMEPLARSAPEQVFAGQVAVFPLYRAVLRYREGISTDMRLLHGSRRFDIRQILHPINRNVFVTLIVQEISYEPV
jgi:SPP1 family predicted phage head-tail adaptor